MLAEICVDMLLGALQGPEETLRLGPSDSKSGSVADLDHLNG
jgi:hypothetical protein